MQLDLIRDTFTMASTTGELRIGGRRFCYTLEPEHPRCIPEGTYPLVIYHSPRLGYRVLLLQRVPGHQFIEIHRGNTVKDTQGCILVGSIRKPDEVDLSKEAHDRLLSIASDAEARREHSSITVRRYVDPPTPVRKVA